MAFTPPRPTSTRQPMPSVTREVSAPEMTPLVDATRPADEGDTASMGGAEMDALLAGERSGPQPAAAHAPVAAPSRPGLGAERPRISVPPAEPTVVLAPQLTAPAAPVAPEPPAAPVAPPPEAVAVLQHAKTEAASPFEATRVGSSYVASGQPRVAAEPPKTLLWAGIGALVLVVTGAVVFFAVRGGSGAAEGSSSSSPGGSGVAVHHSPSSPGGSGVAVHHSPSSPGGSGVAAPSSSSSAGGTPPAPGNPPSSPGGTPPAPAAGPEAEARAALARLRDGIGTCVRDVIGVLPGTSPPIPTLMATLKTTAYQSVPRDYRSPVWSCTKFRESEPQRYQIQWQLVTRPSEGRGVAWLDDDDDGRPDRAFAFRAALTGKKEVELGEIGPLTPVPPVMKALE